LIKDVVRGAVALGLALVLPVGMAVAGSRMASASERGGTGADVVQYRIPDAAQRDVCWFETDGGNVPTVLCVGEDGSEKRYGYSVDDVTESGTSMVPTGRTRTATVNVGALPSSDCWWEVGMRDDDGRPGGSKSVRSELMCP